MKAIYKGYAGTEVKPQTEWDSEVLDVVNKAIKLTEGKNGFKTYFETWRKCELIITVGHNIYTTSIEIRPLEKSMLERAIPYHNGYAFFYDRFFWGNMSHQRVELI